MTTTEQDCSRCLGEGCATWQNMAISAGGVDQMPETIWGIAEFSQYICRTSDVACELDSEDAKAALASADQAAKEHQNA